MTTVQCNSERQEPGLWLCDAICRDNAPDCLDISCGMCCCVLRWGRHSAVSWQRSKSKEQEDTRVKHKASDTETTAPTRHVSRNKKMPTRGKHMASHTETTATIRHVDIATCDFVRQCDRKGIMKHQNTRNTY